MLERQLGDRLEGRCRAAEEIDEQTAWTGVLIADDAESAAFGEEAHDASSVAGLVEHDQSGTPAKATHQPIEIGIVQPPGDDSAVAAEQAERLTHDFPVAEVPRQDNVRLLAVQQLQGMIALPVGREIDVFAQGLTVQRARQTHQLDDHQGKMMVTTTDELIASRIR